MNDLAIVIIGRNEGERLVRCLASIKADVTVVYVDSGSADGSVAAARAAGADVVQLDMTLPFTAARARNAGWRTLSEQTLFVQFIDGDCMLQPGWLTAGRAALEADDGLAVVFGRCREVAPEASRYNWLCDVEWAVSPGSSRSFGGIAMLRRSALVGAGGYPDDMIAGEEPDLAIRLRERGWRIACLPSEMALHDAAMTRFEQWWRRARRSGHAMAELAARHPSSGLHDYARRSLSALVWGALIPVMAIVLSATAVIGRNAEIAALAGAIALLPLGQILRLSVLESRRHRISAACVLATYLMLAKPAQSLGILRYWSGRLSGARSRIIEYKA